MKQISFRCMQPRTKKLTVGISLSLILLVIVSIVLFRRNSRIASVAGAHTVLVWGFGTALMGLLLIWFFVVRGALRTVNRAVAELTNSSNNKITSAPSEVSAVSRSLPASSSLEQAAGLAETSHYLGKNATEHNTEDAQQDYYTADGDGDTMTRINNAIKEIENSSKETAENIKVIDKIAFQRNLLALNVIDEIAFQTNLLASDATAKANRAVEASKDLAVVAEELRNLATRAAKAASKSTSMMEESVENGADITGEATKVIEEIKQSFGKTTGLAADIVATLQERADGGEELNGSAQMDIRVKDIA